MNYGDLIRDSFRITWRNRYLWFFGFFASMGSSSFNYSSSGNTGGDFDEQSSTEIASISAAAIQSPFQNIALIIALIVVGLVIFLIFFAIYLVSQGGLTDSVAAIERGQRRSFSSTWRAGTGFFWRVLGQVLLFVGIVLGLLLVVAIPIGALVGGAFLTDSTAFRVVAIIIAIPIGIAALLAIFIPIAIIRQFARRTMVVGGDGVIDSVRSGYRMFRHNLGRSLLVWLIQLGIMIAASIALIIALLIVGLILFLPTILLAVAGSTTAAIVTGIIAGVILLPVLIVTAAILGTFNHSYWTLAYLRMTSGTSGATPRVV
ncbi:hypothetical protein BH18ACT10_BH18ACT10_04130 [soil metagenome]